MQVGGPGLAIIDLGDSGPNFGAEGLHVLLRPGQERLAKSRLGSYYARRADGGRTLFAKGEEKGAQLVDLKVALTAVPSLHACRVAKHLAQPLYAGHASIACGACYEFRTAVYE